ncbi:hypothetical protein vseg_020355 [Gypsophila vaccaria]
MCLHHSRPIIKPLKPVPAEECLVIYCKPVELYNILHRRSQYDPTFLRRSLKYKIRAKRNQRLGDHSVIFGYKDQNDRLQRTEITWHFTCPFCLLRCGSFQGLRLHLNASHELFKFDYYASEEYTAVNVSVKLDIICSETSEEESVPQFRPYSYCSKPRKRKRPEDPRERGKNVFPQKLELPFRPAGTDGIKEENATGSNPSPMELNNSIQQCKYENEVSNGSCVASNSYQGLPVASALSLEDTERSVTAALPPPAKLRKLSSDRSDSKSSTNLTKRQFYHSHRAQPMVFEQVMADRDSEDEIDHEIASREDQRLLDDFVDVTRSEKHLMRLWNSFVKKQRVLADGHVPWACEAFLKLYGKMLAQSTTLSWCWRFLMVKLWNHGLVDAATMNNCSLILQKCKDENTSKPEPAKEEQEVESP